MLGACSLALVLRLPGVFNGLPHVANPDEPVIYTISHEMVARHRLLPRGYTYPSLHFELNAIAHAVVSTLGRWMGAWDSVDELDLLPPRPGAAVVLNSEPWVVARLITVAAAVLGVALVVVLATRLSGSRRWGLIAGVLAATSGIGVATGFVVAPDALAGTTTMAVIVLAMQLHGPGAVVADRRWAVLTGAMLGLAVGSKYNTAVVAAVIITSVLLAPSTRRPTTRLMAVLAGAAAVGFLISTPGALFEFHAFRSAVLSVGSHYSSGHAGHEGSSFVANAEYLWQSDGLAALLAIAAVALVRTRAVLLLGGWVALYFTFTSIPQVHFERNLTPLLGALAVLGALGAQQVWHELCVARPAQRRALLLAGCLVALAPAAWLHTRDRFERWSYDLGDHQRDAREWLTRQLPDGAAVRTEPYTPWLDEERFELTIGPFVAESTAEQAAGFPAQFDVVIATSIGSGRFTGDRERYPVQAALVGALRRDACDMVRYEDAVGFWIEVYFQRCP